MKMKINKIKPDPNQPRRTFNEEKMKALEASMKDNGFRKQYPIIVDSKNIIVDGERRWRAAKKVGIKEVPVEVKKNVNPGQRLLYQLQSEGAELDFIERNKAWAKLWELSKNVATKRELSQKLGVSESSFTNIIKDYEVYQQAISKIGKKVSAAEISYDTLVEVGKEDKEVIEKAVKEKWTRDKTREIKKAIKEKPLRRERILSQDYSDVTEGSQQWRTKLEIAKSDLGSEEQEAIEKETEDMALIADTYNDVIAYGLKFRAALNALEYKKLGNDGLIRLHQKLTIIIPNSAYPKYQEITKYLKEKGLLKANNKYLEE